MPLSTRCVNPVLISVLKAVLTRKSLHRTILFILEHLLDELPKPSCGRWPCLVQSSVIDSYDPPIQPRHDSFTRIQHSTARKEVGSSILYTI